MKYKIVAEVREDYPSLIQGGSTYNDYVSRTSMLDFSAALNRVGFSCSFWGGTRRLQEAYESKEDISDTIFINYNYGLPAEFKRGQAPILLEMMRANYSGADPFVALLVNDKEYTKRVLRSAGILTPPSVLAMDSNSLKDRLISAELSLPIVVKPNCEGSSLGITDKCLCKTYDEVCMVVEDLLPQFGEVIIEQYVAGYECTVWLIGNPGHFQLIAPLLISEKGQFYFEHKIFTMQDKANRVREYSLPEDTLGKDITHKISKTSEQIFAELGLRDYARIDFRIADGHIYFIEANALPIFSQTSEIGKITKLYNISYDEICKRVVDGINQRLMTKTD